MRGRFEVRSGGAVLWLGVSVWAVVMAASARLPRLFGGVVLISLLLLPLLLGALPSATGGSKQGFVPLLLLALGVGLFVPPSRPARASRVAPRKHTHSVRRAVVQNVRRTFVGVPALIPVPRDTTSPLDLHDIPGYEVLEKIGSGGMASVFRARRKRDGETVALKLPNENFIDDEKFIGRFHREAEVAQRLHHPNVVQMFEHGSVGAKHFMVMEFVDGYSLETYLDAPDYRRNYAVSCELTRQAVGALLHIHEAGVVHRDIKPANLMLRRSGVDTARIDASATDFVGAAPGIAPDTLKLMDFGIAGGQVLSKLTVVGARIGTPSYMSPEQARGLRSDERTDIYSLGLVFYELLTGQPAFRGGYEVIVHQQIFQQPPPPRQLDPRIPVQLERLVMQMIAKEPEARPSLAEVAYRLDEPLELPDMEPRSRLLCAVEAPSSALRILDTLGNLHSALGDLSAALPAPPQACIGDASGHLYVAVTEAAGLEADYEMIHKLGPDGTLLLSFGRYGMQPGEFLRPVALALAPDGSLWVLDAETHRVEHFSAGGEPLGGFGGSGGGNGRFSDPRDLLVDAHGELFVLDYGNRQVQHFSPEGTYKNRWAFRLPDRDAEDGDADQNSTTGSSKVGSSVEGPAGLRQLSGFTLSSTGDLYLREAESGKVHRIAPYGGAFNTLALPETKPPKTDTLVDLGVDDMGNLFAAERGGSAIRKYAPSGELLATLETYAPILQLRVEVRA